MSAAAAAGFVPGSSWKIYDMDGVPSTLTFTATVQDVQGGWASLRLSTDVPRVFPGNHIPQIPGAMAVKHILFGRGAISLNFI